MFTSLTLAQEIISPSEERYYGTNKERLKVNLDYDNTNDTTKIIIDDKEISVRDENFKTILKKEKLTYNSDFGFFNLDQNISNNIKIDYKISVSGSGIVDFNLIGDQKIGISYTPLDQRNINWYCIDGNKSKKIGEAKKNQEYHFKIDIHNNGQTFEYYDVQINNNEINRCNIESSLYFNNIKFNSNGTSTNIKDFKISAGSYFIMLQPGKHKMILLTKKNNSLKNISKEFYIIIDGCGDLICEGENTFWNCPNDCKEVICPDTSFKGDTNFDNIIDEKDERALLNIISGKIPVPERDCCVDLNNDGIIDVYDLQELKKYMNGLKHYERCNTGCDDGTKDQTCSIKKPYFCDYRKIYEDCIRCGCPEGSTCMKDGTCFDLNNCKCSDIFGDSPLGYDNIIDKNDIENLNKYLGICKGDEKYNEKKDLNNDGCIDSRDLECIQFNLGKSTQCSGPVHCNDGTLADKCSQTQPLFCNSIRFNLIEDCLTCGCPPYKKCKDNGVCIGEGNFEIILNNQTKKNIINIITKNIYKNSNNEITFQIFPLKNLENVSFNFELKKNNWKLSTLNKNKIETMNLSGGINYNISIPIHPLQGNELGEYEGSIKVLINNYTFSELPLIINLKEKVIVAELSIKEKMKTYKFWIPYSLIFLAMILILMILIRKRKREQEYLESLEKKHGIILK